MPIFKKCHLYKKKKKRFLYNNYQYILIKRIFTFVENIFFNYFIKMCFMLLNPIYYPVTCNTIYEIEISELLH